MAMVLVRSSAAMARKTDSVVRWRSHDDDDANDDVHHLHHYSMVLVVAIQLIVVASASGSDYSDWKRYYYSTSCSGVRGTKMIQPNCDGDNLPTASSLAVVDETMHCRYSHLHQQQQRRRSRIDRCQSLVANCPRRVEYYCCCYSARDVH